MKNIDSAIQRRDSLNSRGMRIDKFLW